MKKYDAVIIGGGASGIMCAISANKDKKIALIDKADRIGKKILATGNGKCNITNDNIMHKYYNTDKVTKFFQIYDNKKTIEYFENLGLLTYSDEEGRRYPLSNSANSVLDLLLAKLDSCKNVDIITNALVESVQIQDNGYRVILQNDILESEKLIIATGGGTNTKFFQDLGVKYSDFVPSLVGLKTEKNKGLAGVRVSNVVVSCDDFVEQGEILFKEDGISGIVVFNLSANFARKNKYQGNIFIDLIPSITEEYIIKHLKNVSDFNPNYTLENVLEGILHKALAKNILDRLGLKNITTKEVNLGICKQIAQMIKKYPIIAVGLSDNNQVYSGGVSLQNLTNQLEYKNISGLYFIGEVVDVDGVCGGYNLQWAWTSGKIVGELL